MRHIHTPGTCMSYNLRLVDRRKWRFSHLVYEVNTPPSPLPARSDIKRDEVIVQWFVLYSLGFPCEQLRQRQLSMWQPVSFVCLYLTLDKEELKKYQATSEPEPSNMINLVSICSLNQFIHHRTIKKIYMYFVVCKYCDSLTFSLVEKGQSGSFGVEGCRSLAYAQRRISAGNKKSNNFKQRKGMWC